LPRPEARREERVVRLTGQLGDRQGGGVGQPVSLADDELLEAIPGIETAGVARRGSSGFGGSARVGAGEDHADAGPENLLRAPLDERPEPAGNQLCVAVGAVRRRTSPSHDSS